MTPDKRTGPSQGPLSIHASTLLTIVLSVAAIVLAGLGFTNAGNIMVAPATVALFLLASAFFFAVLAWHNLRQPKRPQRIVGLIAIGAMVFTLAMAIAFYQVLKTIQIPN